MNDIEINEVKTIYPKLFSKAHITAAKAMFPEKFNSHWCNTQWTDDEINSCKCYELKDFIKHPSLTNYPGKKSLETVTLSPTLNILDNFLTLHNKISSVLSVGCGYGAKEIFLAKKYPNINFLCIDNAPHTDSLNAIVNVLTLSNIAFKNFDLRNGTLGKFDLVFSMSVIYCIPDDYLSDYFTILNESKNEDGVIIVGCSSNLSPLLRIRLFIKNLLIQLGLLKSPNLDFNSKQTGWIRPVGFIISKIPATLKINNIFYILHHQNQYPKFLNFISDKITPLTNSGYLFILK